MLKETDSGSVDPLEIRHLDDTRSKEHFSPLRDWLERRFQSPRRRTYLRISLNIVGAAGAAFFAEATLAYYLRTHHPIGVAFLAEQTWVVVAYLIRRPARAVSQRPRDWFLAFAGTFGGELFRPVGLHPTWGLEVGLGVQLVGLACCVVSFLALGRSFGFAAADRGLVRRGPYRLVRHPIYGSYLLLQLGYVIQSISAWNIAVMLVITGCNIGRSYGEDRMLATNDSYREYRSTVRWRLVPGIW